MNLKFLKTIAALMAALALFGFLWLHWMGNDQAKKPIQEKAAQSALEPMKGTGNQPSTSITSNNAAHEFTTSDSVFDQQTNNSMKQLAAALSERNVPIHFRGRVVDQRDQPISGVRVMLSVRRWMLTPTLDVGSTHTKHEVITDSKGGFELLDESGDVMELLSVEKPGYRLSPKTERSFSYGPSPEQFTPDADAPVIIRMWKEVQSETLVSTDKDTRIPYDGTPVTFDLLTGEKRVGSSGGDLRITLNRNPLKIPIGYREKFNWHASIEVPDGGLQVSDDEFMFLAPEGGYQPKWEIDMPTTATNWTPIMPISLFVKFRNGRCYGVVHFEFRVNSDKEQTGLTITATTNPNGSRNLQR